MRYVPRSKIQVEMAGHAAVLSGTVRTPIDSKRAEDIACQMVAANGAVAASVVQASRLRDGSRKITHITEVIGMERDVVTLQI